ncbi:hypothetical protein HELRODRAFT_167172 [Helobdella robusta]|uniref:Uncharacterized protein n=1 Tax=Helobdella robusta TaxID=6412 RepID=T1EZ34_HELRO|nr:hypothetical protein HELRODRAFT_167172 [Helobdella robusta]ESO10665.1 hypothetical protein HELRODRAFT_167172 [Helobdella robusta]
MDDDDKKRNTITISLTHKNDGDDEDDVEDGIVFSVPPKLNMNYDNNKNNNKCDDCEPVTTDYKHLYETYKSKSDTLKSELMAKEKLIQELNNSLETVTKQLNHNIMQKRESDFMVRAYEDLERDNDGLRLRVMEIDESKLKVEKTMNECLAALQEKDREMELMKSEKDLKIDELIERLKRLKRDHLILKSFVERVADICGHDNDARNNNNKNADGDDDDYYSCHINEAMVDRLLITLEQKVTKSGQQEVGMGCDNEECLKIKSTLDKNFIEFNNLKFDLSEKLKIIDELKSKIESYETSMELRTQEQIIKNLENKLKSKEDIINELKNDTEIMIGSYKRREILLEEAREAFSQSEESFYNRFEAERDKYVDKIKKLEELVGQGVTESRMNEMKEEVRRMKTLSEKYKNDMMKMRRDFDDSVNILSLHFSTVY